MHFPKFWIRELVQNQGLETHAFGWSDQSIEEARENAREKARKIIRRLEAGEFLESYGYPRGVMREEVIERYDSEDGEEAVISRNRYGALVLNASQTMFVDIDNEENIQKPRPGFLESIRRLFKGKPAPEPVEDPMEKKKLEIEKVLREHDLNATMYQTRAGIRLLILNRMFDPSASETRKLLEALKSDPLYIQLTGNQKCFRARLTPKPWRIGLNNPPAYYPWRNEREEQDFKTWLDQYIRKSEAYGICKCLGEIGMASKIHPQADFIRRLHDQYCLSGDRPLA
jgi:hypothetical protein